MSDTITSLEAIMARLQQLQMQQQQSSASNSNNSHLATPSSTQTQLSSTVKTSELTDKNTASATFHTDHSLSFLKDKLDSYKGRPATDLHHGKAHHTSGHHPSLPSYQGHHAPSRLLVPATVKHVVGSAWNHTQELTDRSISSNIPVPEFTGTLEVEDHEARMRTIETEGNSPAEWQAYIDFLKTIPPEGDIRKHPISEAYSRAFSGILNSREHKHEKSVQLIMDYVHFCSDRFEWDTVDTILDLARGRLQSFAIITVSSAEVKILKGDHEKAMSILTKALAKGRAQPKELLIRAIKSAEAGQTKLLSDQERRLQVPWVLGQKKSADKVTEEFKVPQMSSLGFLDCQMDVVTEPASRMTGGADQPVLTHPPSASKMRHYNSTPEVRSSALKQPWSQMSSSKLNLGMPRRVRLQQHPVSMFSEERDEDTDLMNSIRPLHNPSAHVSGSSRFASLASSGYHSDYTIPTEDSLPAPAANHAQHNEATQSSNAPKAASCLTIEQPVFSEHGDSKQPPVPSHHPAPSPLPAVAEATPAKQKAAYIMSTPSCRAQTLAQPLCMPTPSGDIMESLTVNGEQYFVLKKVGQGGSAQVYCVLDGGKNFRALKVVDLAGAGLEVVDGFRNEISLLQRLQYCDSVIKMFNFELNEQLNKLYVVLEFGETDLSGFFAKRAKQKQGLDPTLIKFYWGEMLRAVNALHKEGIIHSDLKPANFMLVAGNLKLIDFGIANALQQDKTSVLKDSRVGTPGYMSPEAIMAACEDPGDSEDENKENSGGGTHKPKYKVGVRSDVWSLGCILYNMVYGRTPFQHIKNNMMKLQAITNPTHTIQFPPIPDPLLMDVLQKCLMRDVKLRPTTDELLAHRFLQNKDKKGDGKSPPAVQGSRLPAGADGIDPAAITNPLEAKRIQELLKPQLTQGSPRTASIVNRVMDLLQQLESGKK